MQDILSWLISHFSLFHFTQFSFWNCCTTCSDMFSKSKSKSLYAVWWTASLGAQWNRMWFPGQFYHNYVPTSGSSFILLIIVSRTATRSLSMATPHWSLITATRSTWWNTKCSVMWRSATVAPSEQLSSDALECQSRHQFGVPYDSCTFMWVKREERTELVTDDSSFSSPTQSWRLTCGFGVLVTASVMAQCSSLWWIWAKMMNWWLIITECQAEQL